MNKTTLSLCALGTLGVLMPEMAFAIDGAEMADEITKFEKMLTGGYMRLGLLGVCGTVAIVGAVKQNFMMFGTGIGACFLALMMKDWVQTKFACLI